MPATSAATESALLVQVDVTDPTFPPDLYPAGPTFAGALLGHGAGQPAFDPATGSVYVANMPSMSLPTTPAVPNDLTSFVSVIAEIVAPEAATPGEAPGPPAAPIILPFESPDVLPKTPFAWPLLAEGGEGPYEWEFTNLPSWLTAHPDKITGKLDGIIYGTVPLSGSWTFQARVTDLGAEPPVSSTWTDLTLTVNVAAEEQPAGELPFEAGVPNAVAIPGVDDTLTPINPSSYTCTPAPTAATGSLVPAWIDVITVPGGCVVAGTAPISGEYYNFTLSNFKFLYPWDREPILLSGNVAGPYVFDPLPAGVGLSGLAWHEIDKIHDPSTEADVLNAEFIGIEPFTGQLYQILPPQGALEVSGAIAPPEISVDIDEVSSYGASAEVLTELLTARTDIATALADYPNLKVKFGDLVVEANREPKVYVTAGQLSDPTEADPTVIPIGGSTIINGALVKVSGTRDATDPTIITVSAITPIEVLGVQAYFLGLDSDLIPAVRESEPGQKDNGVLWVSGKNTGNVAVIDSTQATNAQQLAVGGATSLGGVAVDPGTGSSYVAGQSLQNVTVFGTGAAPAQRAPRIWSGTLAVFGVGYAGSFSVVATGEPTPAISSSGKLPRDVTLVDNGNGTATLAGTPPAGTVGDFPLTITASNGVSPDATQVFTLTVGTAPVITSASSATFTVGSASSFTLTTTSLPVTLITTLSYTGTLPNGVTFADNEDGTATLAGTPDAGTEGTYPLTITATNGAPPDATQAFTLIVNGPGNTAPAITSHPASQTVTEGQSATFTAAASGNPIPSVQWELSTDNGLNWSNVAGATSASYTTAATTMAMHGYQYRAVFTNTAGFVTTNAATLTINAPATVPTVTAHPANQTVTAGQMATFTAAASGHPTPTVQWQLSTNSGSTWANIAGATSTSYTTASTTTAMNGYRYRAVFTNSAGSATSNAAILTVNATTAAPVITLHPANQTVTVGQVATFTATATGSPIPKIQWQRSTNGGATWVNILGATSTSRTTAPVSISMNGYQFRAVFTNSAGTVTSNVAILTVNAAAGAPAIASHPASQAVTAGQAATFTAAASGHPTPTVQWQLSTNSGSTWANIAGATSTSYTTASTTTAMNGYRYRAVFTNSAGSATSNAAILTVNATTAAPVITLHPANQTVTVGQVATFTATATGSPIPKIQWQRSTNGGATWVNILGATSTSRTTAPVSISMNGYQFRAVFTNSAGTVTSNVAILTVIP